MTTCVVCACRDSGAEGPAEALLQGAAATTLAFVLEEGVTVAAAQLCPPHRARVDLARRLARELGRPSGR